MADTDELSAWKGYARQWEQRAKRAESRLRQIRRLLEELDAERRDR